MNGLKLASTHCIRQMVSKHSTYLFGLWSRPSEPSPSHSMTIHHLLSCSNDGKVVHTTERRWDGTMELSFPHTFAHGNESSIDGTFAPGNFHSLEWK